MALMTRNRIERILIGHRQIPNILWSPTSVETRLEDRGGEKTTGGVNVEVGNCRSHRSLIHSSRDISSEY